MLFGRQAAGALSAARIGGRGGSHAPDAGGEEREWGEDEMPTLNRLETGVMFWAERDSVSEIRSLGVRSGQLAIPGGMALTEAVAAAWKAELEREEFTVVTVFATYEGEDYANITTVQRTVGVIPVG